MVRLRRGGMLGLAGAVAVTWSLGCVAPQRRQLATPWTPPSRALGPGAAQVTPLRDTAAAQALATALLAELSETHAGIRYDPTLNKVAEAAAWSSSMDDVISEASVHNEMVNTLRSGVSPHLLTAWARRSGPEAVTGTGPEAATEAGLGAGPASFAPITSEDLRSMHELLVPALLELVAEAPIESFGISVRRGPLGAVAALVALEPPHLPLTVERQGKRTIVTAPWDGRAAPAAYVVTAQTSRRVDAAVVGDSIKIEVPCHRELADLEVRTTSMFASVVDVCSHAEPRWAMAVGDIGPQATSLVEIEQRAFELLNRERRRQGREPLRWDPTAQAMARAHSQDMAQHHAVSHVSSNGDTLTVRVANAHLVARRTFENVGRAGGPGEMHQGFMTSPGHRENLLEPTAERGGIGAARDPSTGELYFTQVLVQPFALAATAIAGP